MLVDAISFFPQFIKKVFHDHDISKLDLNINNTQTQILMFVSVNNKKSMTEISSLTGLEKSSFTRSVDSLVQNGFITRKTSERDRRVVTLSLTAKGARAAKMIRNDFERYLESLVLFFSDAERKDFYDTLVKISKYVNMIVKGGNK